MTALAIRLDSRGPILFRQPRLGLNNKEFNVLKFRSMYVEQSDFEAREQTKRDDALVTRVGTWLRRLSVSSPTPARIAMPKAIITTNFSGLRRGKGAFATMLLFG